jgi:hypothetical protein
MTRARDLADGKHLTNVDSNTLAVDATNNRVFVGASSGDRKFEVHDTGVVVANFKSTGDNSLMAFDNSSDTSQNHMIGFSGDDFRVVETTEKIRVLSSGGITFNGDTAAANALDDYEEGLHTSSISTGGGSVTLSGSGNKLSYTKIGRFVHVNGLLITSAVSSPTGSFSVSLPFVIGDYDQYSGRASGSVTVHNSGANVRDFVVLGVEGNSEFTVYLGDNTAVQADSANALGANDDIYVSFQYNTTA